jgi:hypothetical protein
MCCSRTLTPVAPAIICIEPVIGVPLQLALANTLGRPELDYVILGEGNTSARADGASLWGEHFRRLQLGLEGEG